MNWYTDACPVCLGTLHDDLEDKGWVTCFSCARSFAAQDVRLLLDLNQAGTVEIEDAGSETPLKRAA
jgi:hypothetical protein